MVDSRAETSLGGEIEEAPWRTLRSIFLHGVVAAFMCVSPLLIFVPAAYIGSGLRHGVRGATGTLVSSALILAAVATISSTPVNFQGHLVEITALILALGLPSIGAVALMRRSAPFGNVLLGAVTGAVTGLFATELVARNVFGISPYQAMVRNFRAQSVSTVEVYRSLGSSDQALREMKRIADGIADSYVVLVVTCIIAISFLLSILMLSRLPAVRQTGGAYLLRTLEFPDALLFAFVAGGISPLATGTLRTAGFNLLGIVGFLYILQGLAIARAMLLRAGFGLGGGVAAALTIGLFLPFSAGALFIAGLFDPFFHFRSMKRKDDSDESDSD